MQVHMHYNDPALIEPLASAVGRGFIAPNVAAAVDGAIGALKPRPYRACEQ